MKLLSVIGSRYEELMMVSDDDLDLNDVSNLCYTLVRYNIPDLMLKLWAKAFRAYSFDPSARKELIRRLEAWGKDGPNRNEWNRLALESIQHMLDGDVWYLDREVEELSRCWWEDLIS